MIDEFKKIRLERHQVAARWKEQTGGKVIGVYCCYVSEEIIHAAGMLPVRILGEHEETTEADMHFPDNLCPYSKSCFDQALKGSYDYLDGLVIPNVCNAIKAMYGFSRHLLKPPYVRFLDVPQRISGEGVAFLAEELKRFKESLEEFSGKDITDEAIRSSIKVYNTNRDLLYRLNEMRKQEPPLISGSEAQEMVISGMLMPKEEHNRLLSGVLEQIDSLDNRPGDGVRLFLTASILDDTDFVRLIEECGGMVVADDMPMGSRYFHGAVDQDAEPILALAERYLTKIACPRKMLPGERLAFTVDMMKGSRARGVIIHSMRACDPHLYEYPVIKQRMESEGLSVLFFKGEETEAELEQQRADLEAFVEMLE